MFDLVAANDDEGSEAIVVYCADGEMRLGALSGNPETAFLLLHKAANAILNSQDLTATSTAENMSKSMRASVASKKRTGASALRQPPSLCRAPTAPLH